MARHQTTNGVMALAKSAANLMQRLPFLPTTPHLALLFPESPNRFPGFINTTFENRFIPDGVASTV
jgi:hypothetical protein